MASNIMPLSIVVADKGSDSKVNHEFVRGHLDAVSIIPDKYGMFRYRWCNEDIGGR